MGQLHPRSEYPAGIRDAPGTPVEGSADRNSAGLDPRAILHGGPSRARRAVSPISVGATAPRSNDPSPFYAALRVVAVQPRPEHAPHIVELRARDIAPPRQFYAVFAGDAPRSRLHEDHAAGQEDGFFNRVGDEQHGQSGALPDVQQLVLQAFARHGVQHAEGPVHQHQLGVVGEHTGEGHALFHPA